MKNVFYKGGNYMKKLLQIFAIILGVSLVLSVVGVIFSIVASLLMFAIKVAFTGACFYLGYKAASYLFKPKKAKITLHNVDMEKVDNIKE